VGAVFSRFTLSVKRPIRSAGMVYVQRTDKVNANQFKYFLREVIGLSPTTNLSIKPAADT